MGFYNINNKAVRKWRTTQKQKHIDSIGNYNGNYEPKIKASKEAKNSMDRISIMREKVIILLYL